MFAALSPRLITRWLPMCLAAFALLQGPGARPARAASVDREFQVRAPELLNWCRQQGYRSLGVLKFRVQVGDGKLSDRVNTLNHELATKLEIALILADDPRNEIAIVKDPNAVLEKDKLASHLSAAGQARLFQHRYPMAWGSKSITPDVFFTGDARLSADLRDLDISIQAVAGDGSGKATVMKFKATPSTQTLASSGRSFVRGAFDKLANKEETLQEHVARQDKNAKDANTAAEKVASGKEAHPLAPGQAGGLPVLLEVYYGDQLVKYDIVNNEARIHEPLPGQPVYFVLKRNPQAADTFGAVLKVNGESTVSRQRNPELHCNKWVLEPNDPPIIIRGYQVDGGAAERFVVLSPEESRAQEISYGKDAGTITLTVFRQKPGSKIIAQAPAGTPPAGNAGAPASPTPPAAPPANPTPPATPPANPATPPATPPAAANFPSDLPDGEAPPAQRNALLGIQRGGYGDQKQPDTLGQLQYRLRNSKTAFSRGLIAKGEVIESAVTHVTFEPDPVPVMAVTIRYYKGK